MDDVYGIRLKNLLALLAECGNSNAELARRIETDAAYISQIKTGWVDQNGRRKRVGDDIARKAEEAFGLEHGWMDQLHSEVDDLISRIAELPPEYRAVVRQQIDALEDLHRGQSGKTNNAA